MSYRTFSTTALPTGPRGGVVRRQVGGQPKAYGPARGRWCGSQNIMSLCGDPVKADRPEVCRPVTTHDNVTVSRPVPVAHKFPLKKLSYMHYPTM